MIIILKMIEHCYDRIQACLTKNRSIQRLLMALEKVGCPIDVDRHFICENDDVGQVRAGFDSHHCQIVVYPNGIHSSNELCSIIQHELIHAFDYCRNRMDFRNLQHLACTEIRAAALSDECSIFHHISKSTHPYRWKNQHKPCVRHRAQQSISAIARLANEDIEKLINDIFTRCYNDTNPFDDMLSHRRQHS